MGKGGYNGGSTIISRHSSWFQKPREKSEPGESIEESRFFAEVMGISSKKELSERLRHAAKIRKAREPKFKDTLAAKRAAAKRKQSQAKLAAPEQDRRIEAEKMRAKAKRKALAAARRKARAEDPSYAAELKERARARHQARLEKLFPTIRPDRHHSGAVARDRKPLLSVKSRATDEPS